MNDLLLLNFTLKDLKELRTKGKDLVFGYSFWEGRGHSKDFLCHKPSREFVASCVARLSQV